MTCRGARSGRLRKVPFMRVEHDGEYATVGTYSRRPLDPAWYRKLFAHPRVELQDGPVKRDYVARQATGAEKAVWWARAVAAFPGYAEYQAKTTRAIPVFVLTPATGPSAALLLPPVARDCRSPLVR